MYLPAQSRFTFNIKDTKKTTKDVVLKSLLLALLIVLVSSIGFEQVNVGSAEHVKKGAFENS